MSIARSRAGRGRAVVIVAMLLPAAAAGAQPVTTVLTHGYSIGGGEKGVWVETMATAILERAGGGGAVCRYRAEDGAWQLVSGAPDDEAPLVLIFNWLDDFAKAGPDWGFAEGAADALHAALRDAAFVDAGGQPLPPVQAVEGRLLHFIGHSRGTCVNSEAVERLAAAGIAVDHLTSLDPHPVNGTLDPPLDFDWGDPVPRVWENVSFADNVWRADGGGFNAFDFDGMFIPGAFDVHLDEGDLNCSGCGYSSAHSDVHLWYHGTIDLAPAACDGEQCINASMNATWWPGGRATSGWFYSALGGGAAQRPALPPGESPGDIEGVYNGGVQNGSSAGWLYHGGGGGGAFVADGSGWALELSAGAGATSQRRHNRFFLEGTAAAVVLDARVLTGGGDGAALALLLVDESRGGGLIEIGELALAAPAGWMTDIAVPIDAGVPRDRRYVLALELRAGAGPVTIRVDNVGLMHAAPCPADVNLDGTVDVQDLVAVVLAWGTPAADIDGNGVTDVQDLVLVVLAWGDCS